MYHSMIKPCLFREKLDILLRAKWDHPVVHVIIENLKNVIYFDNMPASVDRLT